MVYELSIKVQVTLNRPGITDDIHLEFYGKGSNYAEVRKGTDEFIADYVAYHQLENVKKVEKVFADKHGIVRETIEDFFNRV